MPPACVPTFQPPANWNPSSPVVVIGVTVTPLAGIASPAGLAVALYPKAENVRLPDVQVKFATRYKVYEPVGQVVALPKAVPVKIRHPKIRNRIFFILPSS